ncbi:unnamed protein product [Orchesella dallaii]|uniref:Uncharacterized protein n=1 Tax=Orchesella dallaii TaxID=48710 RepID=A0ABP1RVE7_9HEXA
MNEDGDFEFKYQYESKIKQDPDWTISGHELDEFSSLNKPKTSLKRCEDDDDDQEEEQEGSKSESEEEEEDEEETDEETSENEDRNKSGSRLGKTPYSRQNISAEKLKKLRARQAEWQRGYRQRKKMEMLRNNENKGSTVTGGEDDEDKGEDPDWIPGQETDGFLSNVGNSSKRRKHEDCKKTGEGLLKKGNNIRRGRDSHNKILEVEIQSGGDLEELLRKAREAQDQLMSRQQKKIAMLLNNKEVDADADILDEDKNKEQDPDWSPDQGTHNVKANANAKRKCTIAEMNQEELMKLRRARHVQAQLRYMKRKKMRKLLEKKLKGGGDLDHEEGEHETDAFFMPRPRKGSLDKVEKEEHEKIQVKAKRSNRKRVQEVPQKQTRGKKSFEELMRLRRAKHVQAQIRYRERKRMRMLEDKQMAGCDDGEEEEHDTDDFSTVTKTHEEEEEEERDEKIQSIIDIEESHQIRVKEEAPQKLWRGKKSVEELMELRARQAYSQRICRQRKKQEKKVVVKSTRANMSEEKLKELRARQAHWQRMSRQRKKEEKVVVKPKTTRANMSEEELNELRARQAHWARMSRQRKKEEKVVVKPKTTRANMSEEELNELRARQAHWARMSRQRKKMAKLAEKQVADEDD